MAAIPDSAKVSYNFLGRSGLRVANICLGTMTFGESRLGLPGQADEAYAHQVMDRYVEWGGNFLDTADVYSNGESEKIIGTWLKKQKRENFVVATKVRAAMDPVHRVGLSRRHITQSIEDSLSRLQTHYVDLYQTHNWDDATPLEETLRTLDDLVRCGKVRYVGASNVTGWQLQRIVDVGEKLGLNPLISLQQQYSLAVREAEWEPFQVCKNHGIGVLPWSPLKGGLLTGKYSRQGNADANQGRIGWMTSEKKAGNQAAPNLDTLRENERVWNVLDQLQSIANTQKRSVAQVALRWLLQKNVVASVIIGATKLQQLDDNMAAASGWELSQEEMKRLDEASATQAPYPYEMVWRLNSSRQNPFLPSYHVESK